MLQTAQLLSAMFNRSAPAAAKQVELVPGQVYKGTVLKLYPDNQALVQIGGMQVQARLETQLEAGQKAWLQVQPATNPVTLKVLTAPDNPRQPQEATLEGLMRSLGIADSKESRAAVQALISQNMPVTQEMVQAFVNIAKTQGLSDDVLNAFLLANKRNLPLTNDVVASLRAFFSQTSLTDAIRMFIQQADAFLQQPQTASSDVGRLLSVLKQKLADVPLPLLSDALLRGQQPSAAPFASQPTGGTATGQSANGSSATMTSPSPTGAGLSQPASQPTQSNGSPLPVTFRQPGSEAPAVPIEPQTPGFARNPSSAPVSPSFATPGGQAQPGGVVPGPAAGVPVPVSVPADQLAGDNEVAPTSRDLPYGTQHTGSSSAPSPADSAARSNRPAGGAQPATVFGPLLGQAGVGPASIGADNTAPATDSDSALPSLPPKGDAGQHTSTGTANNSSTAVQQPGMSSTLPSGAAVNSFSAASPLPTRNTSTVTGESAVSAAPFSAENGKPSATSEASPPGNGALPNTSPAIDSRPDMGGKGGWLKELLHRLGLSYERHLGQSLTQPGIGGLEARMDSIKSLLLQVTQSPSAALPQGLRDAAETLLQQVTGQQLMMAQPTNQALSQIVLQIPVRTDQGEDTAFIQIEAKKRNGGLLDPENCRLFFHLDLNRLGLTMVDVNIVNRIVNVSICNDQSWLEPLVASARETFASQLREIGYQLSGLRVQPVPRERQQEPVTHQAANSLLTDYKGVDLRI